MSEVPVSRESSRESRRRAIEQARQGEARRKRRMRLAAWGGAIVVVAGAGIGIGIGVSGGGNGSASAAEVPAVPEAVVPEPLAAGTSAAGYLPLPTLGTLT